MMKSGKYRAIRNLPIGWLLQAVHSTDKSERSFRIIFEFLCFILIFLLLHFIFKFEFSFQNLFYEAIAIHTIFWLLTGNFWVYLLDSFLFIKNPGLSKIFSFIHLSKRFFSKYSTVDAILIYGSMCRNQFHNRSDLDLRIIRRTDNSLGLLSLPIGFLLRIYSFFLVLPVDLQVVDNISFVQKQMRPDEKPIIVYHRAHSSFQIDGIAFSIIESSPDKVLKKG